MIEAHTSIAGSLVRLSSEPLQGYIDEVSLARSLYESGEGQDHDLADHAGDIRQINQELADYYVANDARVTTGMFWSKVIGLALSAKQQGTEFLESYSYDRVTRFLAVEYGPTDTPTTSVLREIAHQTLADTIAYEDKSTIMSFFDYRFSGSVLHSYFSGEQHEYRLHPHITKLLLDTEVLPVRDPAMARLLSTLIHQRNEIILELPQDEVAELMFQNRGIFHDRGMTTRGAKATIIDWRGKNNVNEAEVPPEDRAIAADAQEDSDDDQINLLPPLPADVFAQAKCRVDRQPGMSEEDYQKLRIEMVNTMFPSGGTGVEVAKSICNGCKAKDACLDYALASGIDHGVWGGESERGRRGILRLLTKSVA